MKLDFKIVKDLMINYDVTLLFKNYVMKSLFHWFIS